VASALLTVLLLATAGPAAPVPAAAPSAHGSPRERPRIDRSAPEALLDLSTQQRPASAELGDGIPPALTAAALRDELTAAAQRRRDDLAAMARERARLEKLAADITAARAALRDETARLERATDAEAARGRDRKRSATPGRPGEIAHADALAKTLKGMRSEPAAALLARLERSLAVDILRRMRPADAGALLEKLKPETAAELVSALADEKGGSR
jgi:flagellar motility protein MotE (MotC chaperone)